jgi:hypothetical protein
VATTLFVRRDRIPNRDIRHTGGVEHADQIFPSFNVPVVGVLWTDNGHAKSFYAR